MSSSKVYALYKLKQVFSDICKTTYCNLLTELGRTETNLSINYTIDTTSSLKSLLTSKVSRIMGNINMHTITFKRITKLTVIYNILLVIYCLVYMFIGLGLSSQYTDFYNIRPSFLMLRNKVSHTTLSLVSIYNNTDNINDLTLDQYICNEIETKTTEITTVIKSLKGLVFAYKMIKIFLIYSICLLNISK
jgi:hypothetical protein